jgi:guanylate kinase
MRYLFIIGPSGSGKTSLAKKLQEWKPERYKRIVQNTTRKPRSNETEGKEYHFLTQEQYDELSNQRGMIAQVREEFAPGMYGTPTADLHPEKVNVVVASIEAILDSFNKVNEHDSINILFIKNVKPEVLRDNRNYSFEEKYSSIVLHRLKEGKQKFNLVEIDHKELKRIRDNNILLPRFLALKKVR